MMIGSSTSGNLTTRTAPIPASSAIAATTRPRAVAALVAAAPADVVCARNRPLVPPPPPLVAWCQRSSFFSTTSFSTSDGNNSLPPRSPQFAATTARSTHEVDEPFPPVPTGHDNNNNHNNKKSIEEMTNEELMDTSTIPGFHLIHSPPRKFPRGALVGTVVSDKMQKTVNVAVIRYRAHPKYKKRFKYTRKFMAHDEMEVARMGDVVMITPCHKITKNKHFMLREIIRPKGTIY
jgi:small subunit ribosomal protein S17